MNTGFLSGGGTDAFVTINMGSHQQKTKVIKSLKPQWNEHFVVTFQSVTDAIEFELFDYNAIQSSTLIARASVFLNALKPGIKNDLWLNMGFVHKHNPSLHVLLEFQPKITVHVIEAQNLVPMDLNGKSDPYCSLTLGSVNHKTSAQQKTINPVWSNEIFDFEIPKDMNTPLVIDIWDWDLVGSNDKMGQVAISLKCLHDGKNELWEKISSGGGLHVMVECFGFPQYAQQQLNPQYNPNEMLQKQMQTGGMMNQQQFQQYNQVGGQQFNPMLQQQQYNQQQQYGQQYNQQQYNQYQQGQFNPNQQQQFNPYQQGMTTQQGQYNPNQQMMGQQQFGSNQQYGSQQQYGNQQYGSQQGYNSQGNYNNQQQRY
jgi:hypothetical protein